MDYIDNIDRFTDEDNVFAFNQNSDEYNYKKYIMKLFLEVAFDTMSAKEKKIYKMRYEDNMTHEDIARNLNITVNNSKVILHRANNKIMKITNLIEKIKFMENQERI